MKEYPKEGHTRSLLPAAAALKRETRTSNTYLNARHRDSHIPSGICYTALSQGRPLADR